MSGYVWDGILLGAVISPKRIKKLGGALPSQNEAMLLLSKITNKNTPGFSFEDAKEQIHNIITSSNEDARSVCQQSNPYASVSEYFLGIFWKWGVRGVMFIDDEWRPLYKKLVNSEVIMKEEKNCQFGQKIFEIGTNIVKDLKLSEIQLYEVRFFEY